MARRVRPAGGLTSLMGSDSEPDFGGMDDDFSTGVRKATTMKKAVSRPMSSQRANKPFATTTTTGRPASKNLGSRSPPRKVLLEKTNANARYTAKPASKGLLSDDEDGDSMDLLGSNTRPAPSNSQKPTSTKRSWSRSMSPEDKLEEPVARKRRDYAAPSKLSPPSKYRSTYDDSSKRGDDSHALQRQVDELKRKYDNLETRHQELLDVGVKSAERNYDKLRQQTEERANSADLLIAELKAEVKHQTAAAGEVDRLRRKLAESQAHAKELQAQIADLRDSASKSQREIQTLSTKLEASRAAEVNGKMPGSAIKGGNNNKSWTGQSELVHAARIKEDMYSDLTGLLVRGMEESEEGPIFDCLQTGKNGTLHFKLGLQKRDGSTKYEDMEFAYAPQLQDGRDADLMDLLPEFLLDDIEFPRLEGPKFYYRIVKALMEKRMVHD